MVSYNFLFSNSGAKGRFPFSKISFAVGLSEGLWFKNSLERNNKDYLWNNYISMEITDFSNKV